VPNRKKNATTFANKKNRDNVSNKEFVIQQVAREQLCVTTIGEHNGKKINNTVYVL